MHIITDPNLRCAGEVYCEIAVLKITPTQKNSIARLCRRMLSVRLSFRPSVRESGKH